jgi:D-alanine-D-alanine ligase
MGSGAALRRAAERLGYPIVVKPAAQGSALGFGIVDAPTDLTAAAMAAFNYGDRLLLEAFVPGAELSVGVHGTELASLPAVEIRTSSGVYDFQARVSPGAFDYVCPATLPSDELEAASHAALEACAELGVRDFGRVDLRVGADGPVVLDVKTCPGLTESSIVPLAVASSQRRFEDFIASVVDATLSRTATARR